VPQPKGLGVLAPGLNPPHAAKALSKNIMIPDRLLGNYAISRCNTAISCYEIGSQSPKNAKFPVKFPVSREFAWRRVRSALRRQPGSPGSVPDTWVTVYTEDIGNTFGPKGFATGSSLQLSLSKYPRS
jgi:hypothetical protein